MTTAGIPAVDKDGKPTTSQIVTGSNASAFAIKQQARKLA